MPHALVTGAAGFIGSHLVDLLLAEGWRVTAIDNFDPFYSRLRKEQNLAAHRGNERLRFVETDIRDLSRMRHELMDRYQVIVHLAAKAGVRPSIEDPLSYQEVNVRGTHNLLELAKDLGVPQFIFASSSSVYGVNPQVPWSEQDHHLMPISPYASTKLSGEFLGHVYSHLFGIRFVALRFFTVYGPRQRPDLAIHKFASLILEGRPIPVFGDGSTSRDYTFCGDIVQGIRAAMDYRKTQYEIVNLGNNRTVTLLELIGGLEKVLGIRPRLRFLNEQPGDVRQTWASIEKARTMLGYQPATPFLDGLERFAEWFVHSTDAGQSHSAAISAEAS